MVGYFDENLNKWYGKVVITEQSFDIQQSLRALIDPESGQEANISIASNGLTFHFYYTVTTVPKDLLRIPEKE